MNKTATIIAFLVIVVSLTLSLSHLLKPKNAFLPITNYEECANSQGSRILESFPEQCITADGQNFTRQLTQEEQQDLTPPTEIPITNPRIDLDPILPPENVNKCKISGCNGEICQNASAEEMASICIYDEKFACYKNARCEVQFDGNCAWTQTEKLNNCLNQYPSN